MSTSSNPSKSLPGSPSEEHLRKEAKRFAKRHGVVLAVAQRRLAHEYGFRNWAELILHVKTLSAAAPNESGFSPGSAGAETENVLPLLPLRELVAFPHVIYPVFVGRPMSIKAIRSAEERKLSIVMAAQKDATVASPSAIDIYEAGVVGRLIQVQHLPDGTLKAVIEGEKRARVTRFILDEEFFKAEAEELAEPAGAATGMEKLLESVASAFVSSRFKSLAANRSTFVTAKGNPTVIADTIASYLPMEISQKQMLLELLNPAERLEKLLAYLTASS